MSNIIEENATKVLVVLFENNPDKNLQFDGKNIVEYTGLSPNDINDAIEYLDERGLVERFNYLGTSPFKFGHVYLNSRGNYIYHELSNPKEEMSNDKERQGEIVSKQPLAAGSPFGFTDIDWEYVQQERKSTDKIKIVFGYQFKSDNYDTDKLIVNLDNQFQTVINKYNLKPNITPITLDFKPLAAGYGEHLFNQIARDIISTDIAVFETSDLNPNVMIEMGVALTWGKRVLPIKKLDKLRPPSDISGQTYADYDNDGLNFVSKTHQADLLAMVERAIQKKQKE
jgi:hypothetical protein